MHYPGAKPPKFVGNSYEVITYRAALAQPASDRSGGVKHFVLLGGLFGYLLDQVPGANDCANRMALNLGEQVVER